MSTPEDPYASPRDDRPTEPTEPAQQGQPPYGEQPSYGPPPQPGQAQPPYGQAPYGQAPYGQAPYGQGPYPQQGWSQPGQQGWVQPGYGQAQRGTNGLAIAALVCAAAGLITCVSAPVGLVLGIVALSQIKRTPQPGRGLALAGIWIGAAVMVLYVVVIAGLIAVAVHIENKCDNGEYTGQDYRDWCVDGPFSDDTTSDFDDGTRFTSTSTSFALR